MALINPSIGLKFISALISNDSVSDYLKFGPCAYLFDHAANEKSQFEFFSDYVSKYGTIPTKETFEQETKSKLPDAPEPAAYYKDKLYDRHVHRSLVIASEKAADALKDKKPQQALETIKSMVYELEVASVSETLYDFRTAHDIIMQSINSKLSPTTQDEFDFGWDTPIQGAGGDLISLVGRPAVGKTFFTLKGAIHAHKVQRKVPLVISMEMKPEKIFERLSAMYLNTPINWLKTGGFPTLHTNPKKKFSKALKELENDEVPFYVVDGNLTATVDDISALCHQLKPDVVFVDGAYLLQIEGRYSKFEKIGEIARGLKQRIASDHNIPCIASWQFNRESAKVKKTDKVGLEHIAGSDEIGQLSSIVLGLFQEDSAETVNARKIDILKGREGETGEFFINWDFVKMDFSEKEKSTEMILL